MFTELFDAIPLGMFHSCSNLSTLDVSNFKTNKVTDMKCMFEGCEKLTNLDLTSFDVNVYENRTTLNASNMVAGWIDGNTFKVSATMIGDATSWGSNDGSWGWYTLLYHLAANWITSTDPEDSNVIIFTRQSY